MNVISYSLFGYGKKTPENCFEFDTYLRGLWINIRLARVLYPGWGVYINTDESTLSGNHNFFADLINLSNYLSFKIKIQTNGDESLCKSMLWRLKPIWLSEVDRIICRDLDSPLTYREAQMVKEWVDSGKGCHAITDSISHGIPLMGGMIGFTKSITGIFQTWNNLADGHDLSLKGSDQDLLCRLVYPHYSRYGSDDIIQHYIKGMPNTFLMGYRDSFNDIPLPIVDEVYKMTNDTCGHIGAAGWYETVMLRFLKNIDQYKDDYIEFENKYKKIFYWA